MYTTPSMLQVLKYDLLRFRCENVYIHENLYAETVKFTKIWDKFTILYAFTFTCISLNLVCPRQGNKGETVVKSSGPVV